MQESNESKEINEQNKQEEKLIDIKGTLKQFVEADEPELSQEEAIMKYGVKKTKKKNSNNNNDDSETTEEEEHLRRIKQELLASLKRVEELEKLLFKNREEKLKLNVNKGSKNGGFTSSKSLNQKENEEKTKKQKERED